MEAIDAIVSVLVMSDEQTPHSFRPTHAVMRAQGSAALIAIWNGLR